MATEFPVDYDELPEPNYSQKMAQSDPKHSEDHQNIRDAVRAVEVKVGKDGDTNPDSLDKRVYDLEQGGGGGGASALSDLTDVNVGGQTDGEALVWDTGTSKWIPGPGSGVFTYGWESELGAPAGRLSRRFYTERDGTITYTRLEAEHGDGTGTASVELRLNGVAIDTITLNASTYISPESTPNTLSFIKGDYFTVYTNSGGGVSGRLILLVVCE